MACSGLVLYVLFQEADDARIVFYTVPLRPASLIRNRFFQCKMDDFVRMTASVAVSTIFPSERCGYKLKGFQDSWRMC